MPTHDDGERERLKGAELQPTWCWGGRRGCRCLSALPVFWIKGASRGGCPPPPGERVQLSDAFWVGVPVVAVAPEGRLPVQSSGVESSGLGPVGRKEESLMDTKRGTLALCSGRGRGHGCAGATLMEKRCKIWTSGSAEAGLGCTAVGGRADEQGSSLFGRERLQTPRWTLVVPKLSCQEDLGISGRCCLQITDLS